MDVTVLLTLWIYRNEKDRYYYYSVWGAVPPPHGLSMSLMAGIKIFPNASKDLSKVNGAWERRISKVISQEPICSYGKHTTKGFNNQRTEQP